MTRAGTALAGLLTAAALAAGCTGDIEAAPPDEEIPTDDRMFGPDPDYEDETTRLITYPSDKDLTALCADLEASLDGNGFTIYENGSDEPGDSWCAFLVHGPGEPDDEKYSLSGRGAAAPVRVHAWSDETGSHISYFDPAPLLTAVDAENADVAEFGATLTADLAAVAAEASGGDEPELSEPSVATYTEIPSEMSAVDLKERLEQAAEEHGLRLIERVDYEADGTTYVFAVEGEDSAYYADLYETSPAIGVANPVQLHVWADDSDGVISYFDPMPLFSAVGPEFVDAGFELSTILSEVVWQAAIPA